MKTNFSNAFFLPTLPLFPVFLTLDSTWRISYLDPGPRPLSTKRPRSVLGKVYWEVWPSLVGTPVEKEFRRAMEAKRSSHFEHHEASHQRRRWLEFDVYPYQLGLAIHCRDVTERKEAEVASTQLPLTKAQENFFLAEKLGSVGRLAGGVAHDFNNLMTGILGLTQNVSDELGDQSPYRADLEEVITATRRASSLTKQLLAFGRCQVMSPTVFNFNQLLVEMNPLIVCTLGEGVEVHTTLDPRLGDVKADPDHLRQVIVDLLLNARDAMPGGGRVFIETSNVDLSAVNAGEHFGASPGLYVQLSVSDTGTGMSAEILPHIFEPFFTTRDQGKGTGLGLAAVYGIIRQSEGDIAVYSEPGKGSAFHIYLPRVGDSVPFERRAPTRAAAPRGSETILIVEDEALVRRVVTKALRKRGYHVIESNDGADAVRQFESHAAIDLLLTDVVMPGMNGRELAEVLLAKRSTLRVLFMSGYPKDTILDKGILTPATAFIQKSFSTEALCHKVREVLALPQKN